MASIYYKNGSSFVNIGTVLYPVGSVYISYSSTSPASIYGGSWTVITGRFPYFNSGTGTGGANNFRLDKDQIPVHTHSVSRRTIVLSPNNKGNTSLLSSGTSLASAGWLNDKGFASELDRVGSNDEQFSPVQVNNMPAYQTFYGWRRTS